MGAKPKLSSKNDEIILSFGRKQWTKLEETEKLSLSLSSFSEFLNLQNVSLSSTKILKVRKNNIFKNLLELEKDILFNGEKSKLEHFKVIFLFLETPETFSLKVLGGVKKDTFEKSLSLRIDSYNFLYQVPLLIFDKKVIGIEKESNHRFSIYNHISDLQLKAFLENPDDVLNLLKRNFELINGKGNELLLSDETRDLLSKHRNPNQGDDETTLCPLCMDFSLSLFYLSFRFFRSANFERNLVKHMKSLINSIDHSENDENTYPKNRESITSFLNNHVEDEFKNSFSLTEVSPGSIPVLEIEKSTLILKLPHLQFLDFFDSGYPIWKGKIIINTEKDFKNFKFDIQKRWISKLGKRFFEKDKDFSSGILNSNSDSEIEKLVTQLGFKKSSPSLKTSPSSSSKKKIFIPENIPPLNETIESDDNLLPPCIKKLTENIKMNGPKFSHRKASRTLADLGFKNDEILRFYEEFSGVKSKRTQETSAHLLDEGSLPEIESLRILNEDPDNSSKESFRTLGPRCEKIILEPVSNENFYCPFNDPSFLESKEILDIEDMGFLTDPLSRCSRYFSHVSGLSYPRNHKSPTVWFFHRLEELERKRD